MRWPDLTKKTFAMLWHLRHRLQYRELRTWIHDNLCYLTINCDTGQHSQFLRCLFLSLKQFCKSLYVWCLVILTPELNYRKGKDTFCKAESNPKSVNLIHFITTLVSWFWCVSFTSIGQDQVQMIVLFPIYTEETV